jgi:hypothetical protein
MVFDSVRGAVVIFGGAAVFPLETPEKIFGDTWEHIEGATGPPPPPPSGELESFVIQPATVRRGERATGIVTLAKVFPAQVIVLLTPDPNVQLLFDPPAVDEHPGIHLTFPPGTQTLQFRFRDQPGSPIPLNVPIPIKADSANSSLTASVIMTQ